MERYPGEIGKPIEDRTLRYFLKESAYYRIHLLILLQYCAIIIHINRSLGGVERVSSVYIFPVCHACFLRHTLSERILIRG